MKKRYIHLSLLLAFVVTMSSCSKKFLDEEPSTSVSVENGILTDKDMMEALAGLYRNLDSYYLFGRNAVVFGDLLADNIYLSSTNSTRLLMQYAYTFTASSPEAKLLWSQSYYSILQANRIIGAHLKVSANVNQLRGEAYTIRALCYLNLVNWFATPYTVKPSADGVPLVTVSTEVGGAYIKPARASVADVYTQIIADLDSAYTLMPDVTPAIHTTSSNFIAKYAAKALQARAYLYKGDYEHARDAALLVATNGGYTLAPDANSFSSYWASAVARTDKQETIFELNNSPAANNGPEGMDYIYSPNGLGDLLVTDDTYALYTASDRRLGLMLDGKRGSYQAYQVNKYQNANKTDKDEVKLLRYAEVLLTLAESYARLGSEPDALKYLNQVAQNRDPNLIAYTYTGQALVTAIITERRKELAFEGLRFFDLTRTNVAFTRQNMGVKAYAFYTDVKTTDFRRLQPIPEAETGANANVNQNPGY
ncbi:RagB/SusD family nutrient uptake outer membrane protein [Chitinophaga polysaccharea]|uniref:RagB/SusD family nutrient uptake outer membrane protein n=1 Tax=Chitinophaga TaxID=79328 RepID=UPI001455A354|nr:MULTISPECIES: RagB/SusD family nutrient uptake outer membrane protein [Chitinophaga]NLR60954.1 RagB/SusD family nutrient uptake outer membrane protein [Chitinophaga polysaccharea]NLU94672.1 RagB/SusD family nutrient uptake outer membrane protein [Chitinophaga sp. Ak27]